MIKNKNQPLSLSSEVLRTSQRPIEQDARGAATCGGAEIPLSYNIPPTLIWHKSSEPPKLSKTKTFVSFLWGWWTDNI
jgi:hypothetical protein